MKQLIAISAVLFENKNYEPGDKLPSNNAEFVDLWIKNRAAVWKDIEEPGQQRTKAKRITAPAGLSGDAYPSSGPERDLVGKPPPRNTRGAQPEPTRGRRKSSA